MKVWTSGGRIVVQNGHVVTCPECPCTGTGATPINGGSDCATAVDIELGVNYVSDLPGGGAAELFFRIPGPLAEGFYSQTVCAQDDAFDVSTNDFLGGSPEACVALTDADGCPNVGTCRILKQFFIPGLDGPDLFLKFGSNIGTTQQVTFRVEAGEAC